MTHFVKAHEPVGFTVCGGVIWFMPQRDRVTLDLKLVTCPKCRKRAGRGRREGGGRK